jgi:response regulator receiver domain protein
MRILIVDDEELIRNLIKDYCVQEGYNCDLAESGVEAINYCEKYDYDLIIMDIMMPIMDGFEASKIIKSKKNIPILMLSARGEEDDKINGFETGIDDYVTKPFSPKELICRIKAITKRYQSNDIISYKGIVIDNLSHEVSIDGESVPMTHTQYELLKYFIENKGIALSREKIIENIMGYDYEADDRTIDAHIKLLRSKMGQYRTLIKTIRNVGYKLVDEQK